MGECQCNCCSNTGATQEHHESSCGSSCNHSKHSELHYFLEIADCAWEEVLKDKIKEHILSTQGDKMAELAKIVSETNNERWKHKMEKKKGCRQFKEKLSHFFGSWK